MVDLPRQLRWRAGPLHSLSSKMVRALFNICSQNKITTRVAVILF